MNMRLFYHKFATIVNIRLLKIVPSFMITVKTLSLFLAIIFLSFGELRSQTIPELPPPLTLEIEDKDGYEAVEVASLNFVIRLSGLVYYYKQFAIDEQMKSELQQLENELEEFLMRGDLMGNISRLPAIQNKFRIVILTSIEYQKARMEEAEKSKSLFARINELKKSGDLIPVVRNDKSPM